ncbi:MAG: AMIN domain-containing protein [Gloeomargarita sp. SKYBB_i_bin120]|nr:AMIN domain-containing protein [Gloeomargarita sp. SKYG98]MCS7292314.1 AMIN domain-containing protein [Gloeomargarita sp. SKYB120]MDW8177874.1 AMIN domain-containing protein [Gloeomargarita sp. SKYBB_i_bin120]
MPSRWGMMICVLVAGLVSPAWSQATLQFWRYNPQTQGLEFQTDQPTQPRIQVVDLPGTRWPQLPITQHVGPTAVRIAQYCPDTVRLVVALSGVFSPEQVELSSQGNR